MHNGGSMARLSWYPTICLPVLLRRASAHCFAGRAAAQPVGLGAWLTLRSALGQLGNRSAEYGIRRANVVELAAIDGRSADA